MKILQLERKLQAQFEVRSTLEKALGYRPSSIVNANDTIMPKVAPPSSERLGTMEMHLHQLL